MKKCVLEEIDSGWWCPTCDPEKERLLPVQASRPCQKGLPAYRGQGPGRAAVERLSPRERIERETGRWVADGTATQTADQITATLDRCFGGCDKFKDGCQDGRSEPCGRHKRWVERLVAFGCKQELPARATSQSGLVPTVRQRPSRARRPIESGNR